jgi:ABC-type transport system substrate-binding protein
MATVEEDETEPPTPGSGPGAIQPLALAQVSAAVEKTMGGGGANIPKPPPMPPSLSQYSGGGDTAEASSRLDEDGYDDDDDDEYGADGNTGALDKTGMRLMVAYVG